MTFWIFLAVAAASMFGVGAVAIWSENRRGERESLYKFELMKKLAEQPSDAAERVLQFMRDEERKKEDRKRAVARVGQRLGGTITLLVGMVLMMFLWHLVPAKPIWMVGLFPLCVGLALLTFSALEREPRP